MYRTGNARKVFVGRKAPSFTATAVMDAEFITVSLSDYGGKYLVFLFYPNDFSFVCPTELIAFSNRYDEFKAINCELLGISTDSKFAHFFWSILPRKSGGLENIRFPIIADPSQKISRDYGVMIEEEGVACRGLFIIDGTGIIRQITINDFAIGRSVDETIRLIHAIQHNDTYGEVCPVNWKPGKRALKTDMKKATDCLAGSEEFDE